MTFPAPGGSGPHRAPGGPRRWRWRWRRRNWQPRREHPGIRLRISIPAGPIVEADSEHLHWIAKYAMPPCCTPLCLPGCDQHGWYELVPGEAALRRGAADLVVAIKPVMIPEREA